MRIDRERAAAAFAAYTSAYGTDNPRITLKVEHTLRTAGFAEEIARAEGLSPDDVDLAWLLGLLHDIGRFEQVRRYDSFLDAATVSHAALGVEVLFSPTPSEGPADGGIRRFADDDAEDGLIRLAVGCHSALRLPEGLDARQRTFCEILRDADKIDILKVNRINTCEEIYGVTEREMRASVLTDAVERVFWEHRCVPRQIRRSPVDFLVGHACFAFELAYAESVRIMAREGDLWQILGRTFDDAHTEERIRAMEAHLREWVASQVAPKGASGGTSGGASAEA